MAYYDALIAKWPTLAPGTAAAKLAALNAETASGPAERMLIPTWEIYNAIDGAEFVALLAANQALVRDIIGMGVVDVSPNTPARNRLLALFGAATATRAALVALAARYDTPQVPWWRANGYPRPFDLGDIAAAGLS